MIISGPQTETTQPAQPARSTLSSLYLILGALAIVGSIGAIIWSVLQHDNTEIVVGFIGIMSAILLFGLAEFFQQVTRITAATEETARLMRDQRR